jgi:hypothetical protein
VIPSAARTSEWTGGARSLALTLLRSFPANRDNYREFAWFEAPQIEVLFEFLEVAIDDGKGRAVFGDVADMQILLWLDVVAGWEAASRMPVGKRATTAPKWRLAAVSPGIPPRSMVCLGVHPPPYSIPLRSEEHIFEELGIPPSCIRLGALNVLRSRLKWSVRVRYGR